MTILNNPNRAAVAAALVLSALLPARAPATATGGAPADSSLALTGDSEGTVFRSLTVEGENRVRITFERPDLDIAPDPADAPGLVKGDAMDVLNRTVPDLVTPLLDLTARTWSPYGVRPWLGAFATGPAASFTFDVKDVERWQLQVADSRGQEVARYDGERNPPRVIEWDGRRPDGSLALPGLTYSCVLEAFDKAGNRRRFVGDGFALDAYRRVEDGRAVFLASGEQWRGQDPVASAVASPLALETAGLINQAFGAEAPVTVVARAVTYREAQDLGDRVAAELRGLLPGAHARVGVTTEVLPGAPAGGIVEVRATSAGAASP